MEDNLTLLRIKTKLDDLFKDLIDLSDTIQKEDNSVFYTRAIAALALIMNCGVSLEIAAKTITDGYHDLGIDAVFNDSSQKKLFVVQSKWRSSGKGGITQDEIHNFVEGTKRIINLDFSGCNSKLEAKQQEISEAIHDMDYQIVMIFCHTGNQEIAEYEFRPVKDLLNSVNEVGITELLLFNEINLKDIYEYLANGHNQDEINLDDVILNNWGMVAEPYKAYYGTISVQAIGEWYSAYGNSLFAKNIRYYKGSTEVNQGIKEVLKNEPDMFFYYNNGLKILCKKITRKAVYGTDRETGVFSLEGVSLINGAQTAGAIGSAYLETIDDIVDARVFILLIDLGNAEEKQTTKITKYSNTQNKIENKDFVSQDPEQDRLRMELNLGGIQYLYKTGSKITDPQTQISLDETIVSQACLSSDLSIVALVKRNIGALTEDLTKPPYKLLFNGATNSFSLFNAVLVLRAVDECIKNNEPNSDGRKRLVLIHGNRLLLHLILEQLKDVEGFNNQYLNQEDIYDQTEEFFMEYWVKVYNSMEEKFPDRYPAYIFKNVGRLKELVLFEEN